MYSIQGDAYLVRRTCTRRRAAERIWNPISLKTNSSTLISVLPAGNMVSRKVLRARYREWNIRVSLLPFAGAAERTNCASLRRLAATKVNGL